MKPISQKKQSKKENLEKKESLEKLEKLPLLPLPKEESYPTGGFFPGDFSEDFPEFTDEELAEAMREADAYVDPKRKAAEQLKDKESQ